ncbi:hypothetical protein D3C81_1866420 [compost metagenome]
MSLIGRGLILLSSVFLGVLIMISPGFITGHSFNSTHYQGSLYTAEFIVRSAALIIGLLVIYDGIKSFLKRQIENYID